jgi:hypothetical protein
MKTPVPPARIDVRIEELVLHGVAAGDRHRVADAVQVGLHRLLAERGLPAWTTGRANVDTLVADQVVKAKSGRDPALGAGIARAVHGASNGARSSAGTK